MSKLKTVYICPDCGFVHMKWMGQCQSCGSWSGLIEEVQDLSPQKISKNKTFSSEITNMPVPISKIEHENLSRTSSGIDELDTVLGGGIVKGSMVLIGGDPGIGKSTLLTQVLFNISDQHKVLYVSAEESCSQVKIRCNRLGASSDNLCIVNETELEKIEQIILTNEFEYVVIDSIQAVFLSALNSSPSSVSQIRECSSHLMRIAKSNNITIFIVGHVTKEGNIAGPKVLEHIMDTVLYFEGENSSPFKILRAVKNRFGSTNELGIFEMTDKGVFGVKNPSELLLSSERGKSAGSVATATIEGTRCILVEIQSLVCETSFGNARRMANGIDYNRLVLMLAVLEKRGGVKFFNQDVYLNVMGGLKIIEPSVDLAVIVSAFSALKNIPLKNTVVIGEVGLTGEVRNVSSIEKRIKESIKMGFEKIIIPQSAVSKLSQDLKSKAKIIGAKYVVDALIEVKKCEIKWFNWIQNWIW